MCPFGICIAPLCQNEVHDKQVAEQATVVGILFGVEVALLSDRIFPGANSIVIFMLIIANTSTHPQM
jgi:hypothetical protein